MSLTSAGRAKLKAGLAVAATIASEIAEPLGPDGDRELRALLRKLTGLERAS